MVRMVNQYGSAYKRVHYRDEVEELLSSGWRIVEEGPPPEQTSITEETKPESVTVEHINSAESQKKNLIFKGRYLSQWLQMANKQQMCEIFDYFGIPYSHKTLKSEMQVELRKYIREAKAEKRRQQNDGK